MLCVLAQLNHDIDKLHMEKDEELAMIFYTSSQGGRYLIVLDDLWIKENLKDIAGLFPSNYNGSRVLLTTRLAKVAQYGDKDTVIHMPFLDKDESWYLLRERVFGEGCSCPYQLEKAGKKIAENCEGLPLAIVTVAGLLSKAEKKLEYRNEAADKKNSVFTEAYDEMLKVLFPSYKYLPEHLKSFFLYIGFFPPCCKIPTSKLIKLWRAEGLVVDDIFSGRRYLDELVSRSLVLVHKHGIRGDIKTCRVHSAFIHLCTREAGKDKFFHVINNYDNGFTEGMKSQRMLSIHNNVLFAIKNVYESMSSVSTARSLLCTGPHHQYPVPICFNLKFLRVLDALTIRFYKFPIEVLKLVHLRYFALTCSGKLPSSISKLRDLEYLIVSRHLSINKSSRDLSYLPIEIWEMRELKHLQLIGSNLPDPWRAFLPNLLTLLDVNARCCTKRVLERIPNLKKLGIQIELEPDDCEPKPLFCFDHLFLLHKLQSLKCVIVNPNLRFES